MLKFGKKTLVMGILNVTPDSFSDGGSFLKPADAIAHGMQLIEEGADILDIGGESTRPGSKAVSEQEEMDRILPVIEGLKSKDVVLSVDTYRVNVMKAAVAAGATMINDVHALQGEGALSFAAESGLPVCLMHMKGTPQSMQQSPFYEDVVEEVLEFLEARVGACLKAGVRKENIILDVGIGFGKTVNHNLELLKDLSKFKAMGFPLLLGVSRKSFIGTLSKQEPVDQRLAGSIAAALWGVQHGADILRVHDVKETVQALAVYKAILSN